MTYERGFSGYTIIIREQLMDYLEDAELHCEYRNLSHASTGDGDLYV
jgi:hypothetical protein